MAAWRAFLREHRWLALWLIAAALAVKAFVPQGYMLVTEPGKSLTVAICNGTGPATMTIALPMEPGEHVPAGKHQPQDGSCAFSSLAHAATGSADPVLLLAAIAFLLALGFTAVAPPALRRRAFVQQPSRAPPAFA